jgi:c-di-GMP-related signal transduction protein
VEIHSVRHAITLLGEREFRRWVAIVALVMIAGGKPAKLIRTALTRAYFCEELARPLGLSRNSSLLFLMGLISTANALLDRPMTQVLAELLLPGEIRTALSAAGGAFGNVYETLFAYEKADWKELSRIARNSGYSEDAIPDCFVVASTRATALTC